MSSARTSLESELRDELPPSFAALDDADLERLAGMVRDARHEQRAALEAALEAGLRFIPRLLRGPIKRILGA